MKKSIRYRLSGQRLTHNWDSYFHSYARWTNTSLFVPRLWHYPRSLRQVRDKCHDVDPGAYRRIQASIPILETIVAYAAILVISFFLSSSQVRFLEIQPHPFWLVVIFIPLLYGSALGAFAGCLAFGLHLLLQFTQCACPPDLNTPALMLLLAVGVGELRQRSLNRISELSDLARNRENAVADSMRRLTESEEACRILQQRISRETLTFASLYNFSKFLDVLEVAQVWRGTAEVAAKLIEATIVSVWDYQDGAVQMRATYPQDAASGITNDCLGASPLLRQCLERRKTFSVRDVVSSSAPSALPGVPVMIAAPLLAYDGEVIGFIVVEKIDFLLLTPTAVASIAILASWASRSLHNSQMLRDAREIKVNADLTEALRASTYLMR